MECGKGRNEGRSAASWRLEPRPVDRSPVGRVSDNGLENTQIVNSRGNFPALSTRLTVLINFTGRSMRLIEAIRAEFSLP